MKTLGRWLFWVASGALFVAALGLSAYLMLKYNEQTAAESRLIKAQNDLSKQSGRNKVATAESVAKARQISEKYDADIAEFVRARVDSEHRITNFEMLFCDSGLTDKISTIDLNRYRSIYETERDKVLESAARLGAFTMPRREDCGFQYFTSSADLSMDSLPMLQKRFWIAKSIYESLVSYNTTPVKVPAWSFSQTAGDTPSQQSASVSAVKVIRHRGMFNPPDLATDDPRYAKTRDAMKPFYFNRFWRTEIELEAPAESVNGVVSALLSNPLTSVVSSVKVRRIKDAKLDRYSLPNAAITITVCVLDFDEKLVLPEDSTPVEEAGN